MSKDWSDIIIPKFTSIRTAKEEYIRISKNQKNYVIYFNRAVSKKLPNELVRLGYSKRHNAIILFFIEEENKFGEIVKKLGDIVKISSRSSLSILGFVRSCNFQDSILGRYHIEENIINDRMCWIIYLDNKIIEPKSMSEAVQPIS